MIKNLLFIIAFLLSLQSQSQNLVYKSNGNVRDSENNKISPKKMRVLLASNQKLLAVYNAGRSKKTIGNILLYGGLGLLAADVLVELYRPVDINNLEKRTYPSALTYIGAAAFVISIPVKIGFSKKVRSAVEDYNKLKSERLTEISNKNLEFIANANGLGMRFTLN